MTDSPELARLREILAESGLSQSEFARTIGRDVRNVRRWLAGGPIPEAAAQQLRRLVLVAAERETITVIVRR